MNYYTIKPPEILKDYVRCFWVLSHELNEDEQQYVYRSVADGCAELVFHYLGIFNDLIGDSEVSSYRAGLHSQSDTFSRFITRDSFGIFGAYIYPYAIPHLFGIPANLTTNTQLQLKELMGSEGANLEEQMMLARNNQQRAAILSDVLLRCLQKNASANDKMMIAVRQAIYCYAGNDIDAFASQFALSTRQFNRKFKALAGFSPKTYLRLCRLQQALKQYNGNNTLTQIALECGYYDQAHFAHDVKTFTGYNAAYYFSGLAEGTEYRYL